MTITYAKLGGPPENWSELTVLKDGEVIRDVVEVNVLSRWAIRLYKDDDGLFVVGPTAVRTYKDYGSFVIKEPSTDGQDDHKTALTPIG